MSDRNAVAVSPVPVPSIGEARDRGEEGVITQETMISYGDAVDALAAALPRLEVQRSPRALAEEMLRALLEGDSPAKSSQIRYLDVMFAIADGLRSLDAKTCGSDYEEIAEEILAVAQGGEAR